jgi:formylmethanofuran dehydrogenase subunit E
MSDPHYVIVQVEPPSRCELCGEVKETRPYGPNGEEVCYACGMLDEEAAKRGFEKKFQEAP